MKPPRTLLALAVSVALLVGGCSTDYEGGDKKDFVAEANAACKANGATVESGLDELREGGRVPTSAEVRSYVGDVALPRLQERLDELRQIEPPTADREKVDDIIRAYQEGLDTISSDPDQLADADPFLDAFSKAGAYGLTRCAE